MAQMSLPTSKEKQKQVDKAQRHFDTLQTRYDNAKKIVDEVSPDLAKAKTFLEYVKAMPVTDAEPEAPVAETVSDESQGHSEDVFA